MTNRPIAPNFNGQNDWDIDMEALRDLLFTTPYPVPEYPTQADFPTASAYVNCLVTSADVADVGTLFMSDGTTWNAV